MGMDSDHSRAICATVAMTVADIAGDAVVQHRPVMIPVAGSFPEQGVKYGYPAAFRMSIIPDGRVFYSNRKDYGMMGAGSR